MLINAQTCVVGEKVIFVPYCREHVQTYHEWMKDPWLQEMTASEPLSLEEEYEMQQSWQKDEDKLTFIVLDKQRENALAGDVNVFLNDSEDRSGAEIDVMIAEAESRGKGLGRETVQLMMKYAAQKLGIKKFTSKISDNNPQSRKLFESMGYELISHSDVFEESTFTKQTPEEYFHCELKIEEYKEQ